MGMVAPVGDGVMALARVVVTICSDRSDLHASKDLAEQFGPHGRITDAATVDLDGLNFQRLLVGAGVNLFARDGASRHHACGRASCPHLRA